MRITSLFVLITILLSVQGCGSINKRLNPIQPRVYVDAVKYQEASLSGITAILTLNIENPNDFKLKTKGLDYTMSLAGTNILSGESEQDLSVPASGSGKIDVPVRVSYASLLDTLPKVLETGVVDYNFNGNVHTRLFNIPFDKTGELNLPFLGNSN